MTAGGWALLALAVLLAPTPSLASVRVAALASAGRLPLAADAGGHRRAVARRISVRTSAAVGGGLCLAVVTASAGAALGAAAAALAGGAWHLAAAAAHRRHAARRSARLVAAVQLLVAELRAGSLPAAALAAAADATTDSGATRDAAALTAAARLAAAGDSPAAALQADPMLRPVALAWQVADRAGASPADVLGRVADDFTAGLAQRRAAQLALAGPRSSALLLAGLPVLGIWLGTAMGGTPVHFLTGTHLGTIVCCIGVGLDVLGTVWTQRLLDRAARS